MHQKCAVNNPHSNTTTPNSYKRIQNQMYTNNPQQPPSSSQCKICYTSPISTSTPKFCPSHPQICQPCYHEHIRNEINTKLKYVRCPFEDCNKELEVDGVGFGGLPEEIRNRYRAVVERLREMKEVTRYCPTCNTKLLKQSPQQKHLLCPSCNINLCPQCLSPSHKYRTSCQINVLFELKQKFKQCPKCRFLVQKSQGCDHMACLCGHHFCYLCGKNRDGYQGHQCWEGGVRKRSL